MLTSKRPRNLFGLSIIVVGLSLLFSLVASSANFAQGDPAFVRQVRALETSDLGLLNPAGLAFSPGVNAFHMLGARQPSQRPSSVSELILITPAKDRIGSVQIAAAIADPINMAFDSKAGCLLIFQPNANQLIEVKTGTDGNLDPATLTRFGAMHFGLQNPQGMTVDPLSGHLFILDSTRPRPVRIQPTADGGFANAANSSVDLQPTGLTNLRGVAFEPATGYLHIPLIHL